MARRSPALAPILLGIVALAAPAFGAACGTDLRTGFGPSSGSGGDTGGPGCGIAPCAAPATLAVGIMHSCVLNDAGRASCWGRNDAGQLGDGTTVDRQSAVAVAGLAGAVELALGAEHSCARLSSGQIVCWGANGFGQLGDGTSVSHLGPAAAVPGLGNVVELALGAAHSCARLSSGQIVCWGWNGDGELGNGTTISSLAPAPVPGVGDAIRIAAGGHHTCALRASGEVLCWGSFPTAHAMPAPVADLTDVIDDVIDIQGTPNGDGICVRKRTGEIACRGFDPGTGTPPPGATDVVELAPAGLHTCARRASGSVLCWGSGSALGPAPHDGFLTDATEIATGSGFSCARRASGGVACWGMNQFGELGDGTSYLLSTPVPAWGVGDATAIAAGRDYTCAVRGPGTVACWGANDAGQLGNGRRNRGAVLVEVPLGAAVVEVAAGVNHSCARGATGDVFCWGNNESGQLGDGTIGAASDTAARAATQVRGASRIAVGADWSCAVVAARVLCWGKDPLPLGGAPRPTPAAVPGIADAAGVVIGRTHACALRTGGGVSCWGTNAYDQLGLGAPDTDMHVDPVAPALGITDAIALAAGEVGTCAVRASGRVTCWGWYPEVGPYEVVAGDAPDLTDAVEVTVGRSHACARRKGGSVLCWGYGVSGVLGNGASVITRIPQPVLGVGDATGLAAGDDHTCARRASGQVVCWGHNLDAEIDDLARHEPLDNPDPRPVLGL